MSTQSPEPPEDPEGRLREHLLGGRKIEAIKVLRERTGISLKEAKESIEAMEEQLRIEHPGQMPPKNRSGCFGLVLLCAMALAYGWIR